MKNISKNETPEWITVCGGGHGAHAVIGILLLRNPAIHICLYLPLDQEREHFTEVFSNYSSFELWFSGNAREVPINQIHITGDPEEAANSSIIIIVVPAFAHEPFFSKLAPYLKENTTLAAIPAKGGIEFQAEHILGKHSQGTWILFGTQTLPWSCRIREFGHSVDILGTKKWVGASCLPIRKLSKNAQAFSNLLGIKIEPYQSMLELGLMNTGQVLHPVIMNGEFYNRRAEIFPSEDEIPMFYRCVGERTAEIISQVSNEILTIRDVVEQIQPGFRMPNVVHISRLLPDIYSDDIEDSSDLVRTLQTNRAYYNVKAPVKKLDNGYQIDEKARYLTEDIPFGLLVMKGIALILGIDTPVIDTVIMHNSEWMGKEYFLQGQMVGRDVATSRAPQRYKIESLEELIQ